MGLPTFRTRAKERNSVSIFDSVKSILSSSSSRIQARRRSSPVSPSAVYHPIFRLPAEILAHIFTLGSRTDTMFPVVVSHVCSAWRLIALRTPRMWRRIDIDFRETMWRERMRRARACSLDVALRLVPATGSMFMDSDSVQWRMYLVLPFVHRWRTLEMFFDHYSPFLWNAALSECCSASGVQAMSLEELMLVYPMNDDTKEFTLFSGVAPRLRRVTVDGIRLTWLPSLFQNLTSLHYTHHGFTSGPQAVREITSMLRVSYRLVELRILFPKKAHRFIQPALYSPSHGRQISLLSLASLHLRVDGGDIPLELSHLAAKFHTPNLRYLHLCDANYRQKPYATLPLFRRLYTVPTSLQEIYCDNGWRNPIYS
ncbi:hypothetical protein ARMSODRAFT_1013715 [Armillaria solidipes]|uniref:F-box domain-containing protein n=1 Tax=Armillaria solidipes TaxID=1076256 RepID=A0A2H3C664_9AGAR|nr:hypothetical protein ARMSODRAFT_1013715 [Armillaria solidipes]